MYRLFIQVVYVGIRNGPSRKGVRMRKGVRIKAAEKASRKRACRCKDPEVGTCSVGGHVGTAHGSFLMLQVTSQEQLGLWAPSSHFLVLRRSISQGS